MKNLLKFSAIILLIALLLSACSPSQTTVSSSEPPTSQSVPQDVVPPSDTDSPSNSVNTTDDSTRTEDSDTKEIPTPSPTQPPPPSPSSSPTVTAPETNADSTLSVYFLDVGQADSIFLECNGATMLIDGGNVADSNLVYAFLKNHGITHLDYIVATHAHEDHVGGLSGALNYATVSVAYSPVTSYYTAAFGNFVKYLDNQNVPITVPKHGDSFKLGSSDVQIIGPIKASDEPNNTSIVIRVTHGDISFLFTGDAEREEEQDILDAGYDLSATVLKVGHHGSDTSTTYPFLREIMPQFGVISCGNNNSYGHPHENLLSRLRDADVTVYRTDMQGTIVCTSDGKTVSFTTERNASAETNPTIPTEPPAPQVSETPSSSPAPTESYIGNVNSHKFHLPSCRTLPAEHNRTFFDTREAAVSAGYSPCGNCKP